MLTTPITTPHFHSRVLALLSSHLSESDEKSNPPAPIIPPFMSVDTPLAPGDTVSQLVGYASPWIDLCSPDPLIANISRQVLTMEVAYAAFCGIGNLIIPGPRQYDTSRDTADGLTQFARATKEALNVGSYVQMAVLLPMYNVTGTTTNDAVGALAPFAREEYSRNEVGQEPSSSNLFETWDAWNLIRSICKYNSRLSVGKKIKPSIQAHSQTLLSCSVTMPYARAVTLRRICFHL
jgi:protein arginine N-methyltransferase 5